MENLTNVVSQVKKNLQKVSDLEKLEELTIRYLGRHGLINETLQKIKEIDPGKRREFGQKINAVKEEINKLFLIKKNQLIKNDEALTDFDNTLPGRPYPKGSLHMISYATEEISAIFSKIGFIRMTYPEIEREYFSFDSLNMPPDHPGRDDFETFFLKAQKDPQLGKMILSPHTSSGQVREMWRVGTPPIRMISIGKCYRPNWDTTHTPMFHQFESLCVDRSINITHLKGTIDYFVKQYFGEDREARLRPHHFQFTEPSFEVDITCGVCHGRGEGVKCRVCKSGWLELAGAGMVHPNVLKHGKINTNEYNGWAFAFGIERLLMVRGGLKNMRDLYTGDIRFLEQF